VSDRELRAQIITEMKRHFTTTANHVMQYRTLYPTWWFKHEIPYSTYSIRKELERMERDGLVTAIRSQSNNTLWTLKELLQGEPNERD